MLDLYINLMVSGKGLASACLALHRVSDDPGGTIHGIDIERWVDSITGIRISHRCPLCAMSSPGALVVDQAAIRRCFISFMLLLPVLLFLHERLCQFNNPS